MSIGPQSRPLPGILFALEMVSLCLLILCSAVIARGGSVKEEGAAFWAFQPVRQVDLPPVKAKGWPRGAIDRFILAKLEEKGLSPAREAGKQILLKRLTFDLTGLPPGQEEVESFSGDNSPGGVERLVDHLLASRGFGERWGRHWLDVARYADSNGLDENFTYYEAWRFRNYVIDAFNKDKPFDQFVREQLAGDLLPSSSQKQRDEQLTGTGFLVVGPKVIGGFDKEQGRMDAVDEQIDTVGKAFLGLSLGCARCHDHKFDPVPTKDYYALAGIFSSTETVHGYLLHRRDLSGWNLRPLGEEGEKLYQEWLAYDEKLDGLRKKKEESQTELAKLKKKNPVKDGKQAEASGGKTEAEAVPPPEAGKLEETLKVLNAEIKQLSEKPPRKPPLAMAVSDRDAVTDAKICIRGNIHRQGDVVPRGFVQVASRGTWITPSTKQSGRVELAEWLLSAENPLTSRVVVNRVWHHLFGEGLVRTVDDFGRQGETPSHPELLDYLAGRFREVNWSFKRLIREIVLSRAYQQSSEMNARANSVDPENRWLWRMNRRRLEVEAIRDSILAVSGQLDRSPAESTVSSLPEQATGVGDKPHKPFESLRRSVYLPVIRNDLRPEFQIFDFADPQTVSGRRSLTIIPPQSLYLLNGAFVQAAARKVAERIKQENPSNDGARLVNAAYRAVFGRSPSGSERRYSLEYLAESQRAEPSRAATAQKREDIPLATLCQALMCCSEFLYLD